VGKQDDFIATQGVITMIRPLSSRFIAAAVLAAALGAATTAQARPDIQVSIGLPGLPVFLPLPLPPVFVRTEPVFVQPQPVYVAPPGYAYGRAWGPSYRPDFERERDWRHAEWQRHEWQRREWERREWEHRHHDRFPSHGRDRDER
jgi:hypothetical protein